MKKLIILEDVSTEELCKDEGYVSLKELKTFVKNIKGEDSLVVDVSSGERMGEMSVQLMSAREQTEEEREADRLRGENAKAMLRKIKHQEYMRLKEIFEPE